MKEDWHDEDENWSDDDLPDDEVDAVASTVPCPYCGAEIHEDSYRCPFCEQYILQEDSVTNRKPLWLVLGVLLCLALVLMWIFPWF